MDTGTGAVHPDERCAGIILAGGQSSRMGTDKALLTIDGETLLARTVRIVAEVVEEILIVGRTEIPCGLAGLAVADDVPGMGPIGGIATGLRRMNAERAVVVSCDLPFLDAAVLRLLLGLSSDVDAVVPQVEGRGQPTCAVYRKSCLSAVERQVARGDYRLGGLLEELTVRWVTAKEIARVDAGTRSLRNVNTAADWNTLPGARTI